MLHIQMLVLYTHQIIELFTFYFESNVFTLDNLQQVCILVSCAYRVYRLYELEILRDNISPRLTEKWLESRMNNYYFKVMIQLTVLALLTAILLPFKNDP